jgi:oligopeptide transport system ATP-binding protein
MAASGENILEVRDLEISFKTYDGEVQAVRGVTFDLRRGETLAIVGESGSGKSVTAKSIMRLLPEANSVIKGGEATFEGRDLLKLSDRQMQGVRGSQIAKKHLGMSGQRARERSVELMQMVGIPNAEARLRQYPHQFSGGMRQRVVIAIALSCDPQILIADEPTTALDVTIQAQILELLRDLQERIGTSVILITHDLGVVAQTAHRVVVMYGGKIVEMGTVREIFYNAQMPYTWGLLSSIPLPTADRSQDLIPIPGSPPDMLEPPEGCPFTPRCPHAMRICAEEMPGYTTFSAEHKAACWLHHPMAPDVEPPVRVRDARGARETPTGTGGRSSRSTI